MTMCSGEFLQERIEEFCNKYSQDQAYIWQVINRIHTRNYGRNIMWEKQKEEQENNLGDIPMSQAFAKEVLVHNVIYILKGLENCCENGWEFE